MSSGITPENSPVKLIFDGLENENIRFYVR